MSYHLSYQWVDCPELICSLAEQIPKAAQVAVDTEFIKSDRFYACLGVLQLNLDGSIFIIDGTVSLKPIWNAFSTAKQLTFHACSEDLDVLYHYGHYTQALNIFDTQIALAYLGYGRQLSYQTAVEALLNVIIDKNQTRSDWLTRPLTDEQLRYAAEDVFYLNQIAQQLSTELESKSTPQSMQGVQPYTWLSAVQEDCLYQSIERLQQQSMPFETYYQSHCTHRHSEHQQMQLQRLYAWREKVSRQLDKPRSYFLRGNDIALLVRRSPKNLRQLAQFHQLHPSTIRKYGQTLLDLLHQLPPAETWPKRLPAPIAISPVRFTQLDHWLDDFAQRWQISVETIMRKKWLKDWVQVSSLYVEEHFGVQLADDASTMTQVLDILDQKHYRSCLEQHNVYWSGWRFDTIIMPLLIILLGADTSL